MRVTAVIIMRNEAVLIASKLAACAAWADDLVVIDQHSEDGSMFIAREALRLLNVDHQILTTRAPALGSKFSWAEAFEAATGDWVLYTDVDEILLAPGGLKPALAGVPPACAAPGIFRWHAIVNGDDYFKVEAFERKRFRALRKPGAKVFEPPTSRYRDLVHRDVTVEGESEEPLFDLPREEVFLMEFKAPHQHYADQLFYEAVGGRNDRKSCEETFSPDELAIGRALYQAGHRRRPPVKRWWHRLRRN